MKKILFAWPRHIFQRWTLQEEVNNDLAFYTAVPMIVMLTMQIYSRWDTQSQPLAAPGTVPAPGEEDDGEQTANN